MSRSSELWPSVPSAIRYYTVAVLAVAAAVIGGLVVDRFLHTAPFVSLFLCAILLAAWLGGAGPGLLATGLSILAFKYYFIPPEHSFIVGSKDLLRIALFTITAMFVISISLAQRRTAESLRRARDDLRATVRELEKLNNSLQAENAERMRAEQSARQAERDLQVTIDTIPTMVARFRRDGSLDFANQTCRTYTGLSQDSLRDQGSGVAIHPDDLPISQAAWSAHLPTGQPFQMEQRLRRADGEYRWHLVRRVPHRNENGEVIGWYGVADDIEDQKRAERALRRSETYLAEGERLSQTGSFAWKIASAEIFWSKEIYRIIGINEEVKPDVDLIRQRVHPDDRTLVQANVDLILQRVHADDRTLVRGQLDRAARGEQDYDYEHRFLMPDGVVKHVRVRAHHQVNEAGEEELVGALMDITATRKAQDALQRAQAELAHVTRVTTLGEMSASIAHEVNQPLAAIVTNGEATLRWLRREIPDIEESLAAVGQVVKNAYRASDVIRRIREFSKKADPEMIQLDINEVVNEAVTLVRHEAHWHGVAMQLELALGVPPVRGDRIQLQQVIINLVANGIEAMATVPEPERVLIVRTQLHQPNRVLVAVEDAGVGIEPENADRLFSAFHTTKPDGLGIGLSICRSIVEAHGGRVWASHNAGPGMTFQFTVPTHGQ